MKKITLATILAFSCCSTLYSQSYTFESLAFPEAFETYAYDINNDNVVVGSFLETFDGLEFSGGFIWKDGEFDLPLLDLLDAGFHGVNDAGTIVGVGIDFLSLSFPSFTLEGEELTLFDYPDAVVTIADGINNAGEIVGEFILDPETEFFRSFRRTADGEFVELSFAGYPDVFAVSINNQGHIVGGVFDEDIAGSGFILGENGFEIFNHSDGETELTAINDLGTVAGIVDDGESVRAFVFDGNDFHDVMFPGATETTVWGINNHGVVVGEYMMPGDEFYTGFVGFPVPEPSSHLLLLGAMVFVATLRRTARHSAARS